MATLFTDIAAQRGTKSLPLAIWTAVILAIAIVGGITLYEYAALNWHPAREEPAAYSNYHWLRMAISACAAAMMASALQAYGRPAPVRPSDAMETRIVSFSLAGGVATIALLLFDRDSFHALAAEDRALEWGSALLLFAGSGCFLLAARRGFKSVRPAKLDMFITLGFAGLLFLIAMEEISWGQRIIGFATPGAVAEMNWQAEFNFHNIQTDISELGYYLGAGALLIVLPLVKELLPDWPLVRRFATFIPGPLVAAISAPMLFLSYGHWNLMTIQLLAMFGVLAMVIFAQLAARRGDLGEATLFAASAAMVVIGQIAVLVMGPAMVEIFDATEYREFFIALGLACFAWQHYRLSEPPAGEDAH